MDEWRENEREKKKERERNKEGKGIKKERLALDIE